MTTVKIFTDAAVKQHNGGIGVVLVTPERFKEHGLPLEQPTQPEQGEIAAILYGLHMLKYACKVEIYSDAQRVVDKLCGRLARKSENNKLWFAIDERYRMHESVKVLWLHRNTHPLQLRAHQLAQLARGSGSVVRNEGLLSETGFNYESL